MQDKPQKRILVIGSFITDLVFRVDRYPEEGETLIGHSF
ncbi:MAG: ribokinase, partial [Firmicutes bacterium]|nr:ribokinase [Bacillota bacterium]